MIGILLDEAFSNCLTSTAEVAKKFLLEIVIGKCSNNIVTLDHYFLIMKDCFEGTSEFYTPLHAISEIRDISSEILKTSHSFLLSKILTFNPSLSGRLNILRKNKQIIVTN